MDQRGRVIVTTEHPRRRPGDAAVRPDPEPGCTVSPATGSTTESAAAREVPASPSARRDRRMVAERNDLRLELVAEGARLTTLNATFCLAPDDMRWLLTAIPAALNALGDEG